MHSPHQPIPLTPAALTQFKSEFDRLTKERKEVLVRLQTAREMGDLSENGAYKYAKLELGTVSRRLRELKHIISNATLIAQPDNNLTVQLGSTVTLRRKDSSVTYTVVGFYEANPQQQKISDQSPIGQAIMGKQLHDKVSVNTPAGTVDYTIEKIA